MPVQALTYSIFVRTGGPHPRDLPEFQTQLNYHA